MNFHNLTEQAYFVIKFLTSFVVFINSFFMFIKTQNLHPSKMRITLVFVINIIISFVYGFLNPYTTLIQTLSFLGIAFSFTLLNNNKTRAILISLVCISFAHVFKLLSLFFIGTLMWILQLPLESMVPYFIEDIFSVLLTILFINIKRLKNGIQFFEREENLGLGLIISGLIFILVTTDFGASEKSVPLIVVLVIGLFISSIGLYFWIRKGITKHYREKLQLKSEIYYKEQLEQKEQDIERLNQSNEFLAKIVHRDNHLMDLLNSSINAYFESDDKEFKDGILHEIQTLSKERGELIKTEQRDVKLFPSTGNMLIDGAISDLYIKAASHGIDFDVSVSATVDEVIGKYISQTDLQTLICDHIKDAIIAVDAKNENNGKIIVEFSKNNDNYSVTFFDSGVDFEIDTLAKLGKERVTTHADNGGSGIGFMTTFETLRKSYASLIITEFENKTPFSKSVSIRFDGNTAFIIQSYRKEELKSVLNRDDVVLL